LFLAGFSSNKVEGLAAFKGINLVLIAPAAVMFIQGAWQYVFTVIPTYWLYQSLDLSAANQPWGHCFCSCDRCLWSRAGGLGRMVSEAGVFLGRQVDR
jgi:hypothetical protein